MALIDIDWDWVLIEGVLINAYGLKPEVWGRVGLESGTELQAQGLGRLVLTISEIPEIHHFVLHHPNRQTVIHLAHHIMANRDVIWHKDLHRPSLSLQHNRRTMIFIY